ncbi:MAG: MltA domain-containing protein [Steroidobacteraceae bacterium]
MRFVAVIVVAGLLQACGGKPAQKPAVPAPAEVIGAEARFERTDWSRIDGWVADEVEQAWGAFVAGCGALRARPDWKNVCDLARQPGARSADARRFFETQFDAYRISYGDANGRPKDTGLITAYYEPVLRGARTPGGAFKVPLYGVPDDLLIVDLGELYPALKGERVRGRLQGKRVVPYYERGALETNAALKGKELVWVDDAVDAFFLQIQGSGRVLLPNGQSIRLAYADVNGQPYRSIGRYLADRGYLPLEQTSASSIRDWLAAHPERSAEVFNANPSVVFFREERIVDASIGPKGALGVPLTAGRSIAIDPRQLPLGAPVFLSTTAPGSTTPLMRLTLAQDTGGAIRGPVRADLFWGLGHEAGMQAGNMKQEGRLWLLWPKGRTPPPATVATPGPTTR